MFSSQLIKKRLTRRSVLQALAGLSVAGASIATLQYYFSTQQGALSQNIGQTIFTYHGHTADFGSGIADVVWSPDGKSVASAVGFDQMIHIWQPALKTTVLQLRGWVVGQPDANFSWSPDSTSLVAPSLSGGFSAWNVAQNKLMYTYGGYVGLPVVWSPDGKRIAGGSYAGVVAIWDASTAETLLLYEEHAKTELGNCAILRLSWSPDNRSIASIAEYSDIHVWKADTGNVLYTLPLKKPMSNVTDIAWSASNKLLAAVNMYTDIAVWEAASGKILQSYTLPQTPESPLPVKALAWSPDDRHLAIGYERTVQIREALTGKLIYTYRGHFDPKEYKERPANSPGEQFVVTSVDWSPDGNFIASGAADSKVKIWRAR